MNQQILVIHGGDVFETREHFLAHLQSTELDLGRAMFKGWKQSLPEFLGEGFEVIQPSMPNKQNAHYDEWKIWFEKYLPFLRDDVILIGHSLGGTFLAKYLSENDFPKKIRATLLVAAVFDLSRHTLADFALELPLTKLEQQAGEIYLFQSKDDEVVLYENVELYVQQLPNAKLISFEDRGHFHQEVFPELVDVIKTDC